MKILLVLSLFITSAFANANPEWWVKCYEKEDQQEHQYDLAWKIGVNGVLSLWKCSDKNPDCEEKGYLEKEYRQDETCLVSKAEDPALNGFHFELCRQEQESDLDNPHKLIPVTIEAYNQEMTAYCERSLLKLL